MCDSPSACAASRTASMQRGANGIGAYVKICSICAPRPVSSATRASSARSAASLVEHRVVGMTEFDREEAAARHGITRVRPRLDHPDRCACVRRVTAAEHFDERDHPRGADQRVAAEFHRRRARMRVDTGERHLVPALPLPGRDDADRLAGPFENRALFDMQLVRRMHRIAADRLGARVADPRQFLTDRPACAIGARQPVFERRRPRIRRPTPSPARSASLPRWSRSRRRSGARSRCPRRSARARPRPPSTP